MRRVVIEKREYLGRDITFVGMKEPREEKPAERVPPRSARLLEW